MFSVSNEHPMKIVVLDDVQVSSILEIHLWSGKLNDVEARKKPVYRL